MSSFLMRLHGQHGWHLHGTSTTPQWGSRNTWTRWIPWIHGGVGFGLNLPNLPTVGSKEIWYQNGNTKPPLVDLFWWFQSLESWQVDTQRLGYRDASHMFGYLLEIGKDSRTRSKKPCEPPPQKHVPEYTSSIQLSLSELHASLLQDAVPFAAGRPCSATDPHVSSITWFSQWAEDYAASMNHWSLVAIRFTTKLCIPPCLKQTIGTLRRILWKRGFELQYHLTILQLNLKSTKGEHQQRFSNKVPKKIVYFAEHLSPLQINPVFWMVSSTSFPPGDGLHAVEKSFIFFAKFPCKRDMFSNIAHGYIITITLTLQVPAT